MTAERKQESREQAELWLDTHEPSVEDVLELIGNAERETRERCAQKAKRWLLSQQFDSLRTTRQMFEIGEELKRRIIQDDWADANQKG